MWTMLLHKKTDRQNSNHLSDKELISKMYKELTKFNSRKTYFKNEKMDLNIHFPNEDTNGQELHEKVLMSL